MRSHLIKTTTSLLAVLLLARAVPMAVAGDEPCHKNGHGMTVEIDDDQLTFICHEDGQEKITVLDLDGLDEMVDEVMEGVGEALAGLDDLQLDLHFGQDNMVRFATADQEFEVNLELIASQVGHALEMALAELDHQDWSEAHQRHRSHVDLEEFEGIEDLEDLQSELDVLREEMTSLKRELKRLQEEDR